MELLYNFSANSDAKRIFAEISPKGTAMKPILLLLVLAGCEAVELGTGIRVPTQACLIMDAMEGEQQVAYRELMAGEGLVCP